MVGIVVRTKFHVLPLLQIAKGCPPEIPKILAPDGEEELGRFIFKKSYSGVMNVTLFQS